MCVYSATGILIPCFSGLHKSFWVDGMGEQVSIKSENDTTVCIVRWEQEYASVYFWRVGAYQLEYIVCRLEVQHTHTHTHTHTQYKTWKECPWNQMKRWCVAGVLYVCMYVCTVCANAIFHAPPLLYSTVLYSMYIVVSSHLQIHELIISSKLYVNTTFTVCIQSDTDWYV